MRVWKEERGLQEGVGVGKEVEERNRNKIY